MSRAAANWIRLLLFLVGGRLPWWGSEESWRFSAWKQKHYPFRYAVKGCSATEKYLKIYYERPSTCSFPFASRHEFEQRFDFDSTLGFPGEGPKTVRPSKCLGLSFWAMLLLAWALGFWILCGPVSEPWISLGPDGFCRSPHLSVTALASLGLWNSSHLGLVMPKGQWLVFLLLGMKVAGATPSSHGLLQPRDRLDQARADKRQPLGLAEGRPVLGKTQNHREKLLAWFGDWLSQNGLSLDQLCDAQACDVDTVNAVVSRYGRELYSAGRPYGHYSETINALNARKPRLKRLMQESWNLAFAWLREEPPVHHVALPWQVLLAMLSVAFIWGWYSEAGVIALSWGAITRVGEVLNAKRADLILPQDVGFSIDHILLQIQEPKTRFRCARHQVAKLDQPELLQVVSIAFGHLEPHEALWALSQQTMRSRFQALLKSLRLDGKLRGTTRGLDMGSLRAGGASWLLTVSEDGEMVRRHGRWLNTKVMDIYVQEVASVQFLHRIPGDIKDAVLTGAAVFSLLLNQVMFFSSSRIPRVAWKLLLAGLASECMDRSGKHGKFDLGQKGHDTCSGLCGEKGREERAEVLTCNTDALSMPKLGPPHPPCRPARSLI